MLRTFAPHVFSPRSLFADSLFRDFDEAFAPGAFAATATPPRTTTGRVNGYRTDDAYHLVLEMPGVKADEVSVQVVEGGLQVDATARQSPPEGARPLRQELPQRFEVHRRFSFAKDADLEGIEASLNDGLLTLRVPRRVLTPRRIDVKVG